MKQVEKETQTTRQVLGEKMEADAFSSLTENEFDIVRSLYNSKHAISARTIQGSIAQYRIQVDTREKRPRYEPIETLINSARLLKLSIPSYTTIVQLLGSLKTTPLIGEREPSEGERAEFVYYLKPAAREYAFKSGVFK